MAEDDERLTRKQLEAAVEQVKSEWRTHTKMGSSFAGDVVDAIWPRITAQLAELSAVRDREAERADKAETLLTGYAVAWDSGGEVELAAARYAILDWYTSAAMKAGQQ